MAGSWSGTFDGGSNHGTWSGVLTETNGVFSGPATLTFATLGTCQHGGKFCGATVPCAGTDTCDLTRPWTPVVQISGSNTCGIHPQLHFAFVEGGTGVFPNWSGDFAPSGNLIAGVFIDNQDFGGGNWVGTRQ
jgi:hypothetical protein